MDAPAQTVGEQVIMAGQKLRMTAREFALSLRVLALGGLAKLATRKPKRSRYAAIERKPLFRPNGEQVWRWERDKDGNLVKVPVPHVILTTLNHGKQYPYSSKRQNARYARQRGRELLKQYKAGHLTINELREAVGLPLVVNGGDHFYPVEIAAA